MIHKCANTWATEVKKKSTVYFRRESQFRVFPHCNISHNPPRSPSLSFFLCIFYIEFWKMSSLDYFFFASSHLKFFLFFGFMLKLIVLLILPNFHFPTSDVLKIILTPILFPSTHSSRQCVLSPTSKLEKQNNKEKNLLYTFPTTSGKKELFWE